MAATSLDQQEQGFESACVPASEHHQQLEVSQSMQQYPPKPQVASQASFSSQGLRQQQQQQHRGGGRTMLAEQILQLQLQQQLELELDNLEEETQEDGELSNLYAALCRDMVGPSPAGPAPSAAVPVHSHGPGTARMALSAPAGPTHHTAADVMRAFCNEGNPGLRPVDEAIAEACLEALLMT